MEADLQKALDARPVPCSGKRFLLPCLMTARASAEIMLLKPRDRHPVLPKKSLPAQQEIKTVLAGAVNSSHLQAGDPGIQASYSVVSQGRAGLAPEIEPSSEPLSIPSKHVLFLYIRPAELNLVNVTLLDI